MSNNTQTKASVSAYDLADTYVISPLVTDAALMEISNAEIAHVAQTVGNVGFTDVERIGAAAYFKGEQAGKKAGSVSAELISQNATEVAAFCAVVSRHYSDAKMWKREGFKKDEVRNPWFRQAFPLFVDMDDDKLKTRLNRLAWLGASERLPYTITAFQTGEGGIEAAYKRVRRIIDAEAKELAAKARSELSEEQRNAIDAATQETDEPDAAGGAHDAANNMPSDTMPETTDAATQENAETTDVATPALRSPAMPKQPADNEMAATRAALKALERLEKWCHENGIVFDNIVANYTALRDGADLSEGERDAA